jgi:ABC-type phosphate transport system permease subunit
LENIPNEYREVSFALGISKSNMIRKILFPIISSEVIKLCLMVTGRSLSESAPIYLILTTTITTFSTYIYIHKDSGSMVEIFALLNIMLAVILNLIITFGEIIFKKIKTNNPILIKGINK